MRHLALDIELNYPLSHPNSIIEVLDKIRENLGDKFDGKVKVILTSYSDQDQSAFKVAHMIGSLIENCVHSIDQIISLNVRTHIDCWEMLKIDIVEVLD